MGKREVPTHIIIVGYCKPACSLFVLFEHITSNTVISETSVAFITHGKCKLKWQEKDK